MKALTEPFEKLGVFEELKKALGKKGITDIDGCVDSAKAAFMHALNPGGFNVIAACDDTAARALAEDWMLFDPGVMYYPARDIIFYQSDLNGNLLTTERMCVMKAIAEHKTGETLTIVTTFDAFMERIPGFQAIHDNVIRISSGDPLDLGELSEKLVSCGYEKAAEADAAGQFAVRGGIIDIFPLTMENPVRIELWGDEVDSVREFDAMSQRSIEKLDGVSIYPASEIILSDEMKQDGCRKIELEAEKQREKLKKAMKTEEAHRCITAAKEFVEQLTEYGSAANALAYEKYFYDRLYSFADCFSGTEAVFFLDEPSRLEEKGKVVEQEFNESMSHRLEGGYVLAGQTDVLYSSDEIFARLQNLRCAGVSTLAMRHEAYAASDSFSISSRPVNSYNKSFETIVEDLKKRRKNGFRTVILSPSHTRAKHMAQELTDEDVISFYSEDEERVLEKGEVMTAYGALQRGFEFPDIGFAVISEADIFGSAKAKKRRKHTAYEGARIESFTDLTVGDYVVHENFGLGIYRGIEHIEIEGVVRDYVRIEYADHCFVNVIASNLESLQKYASSDTEKKLRLNKIGTNDWKKTKQRVRGAVEGVAKELVALYAERSVNKGYIYGQDTVWQKEFEELFPYEETEDQNNAIQAVKHDMESSKIMDRLICGDVGFGKTEVAIRAAFKAVQEGKQVAFLVPTTILAEQHYNTFVQRMSAYPVKVGLLCRFRSASQQKKTIQDMKNGMVDIVIGTHRLLSKDVGFKDLGLLVVDEEQRFGVTHKERIKEMRKNVDVLTLTATPIPRTLHMSLVGIRDMSVLEEPPEDRLPIQTFIMEYNDEMVREAISREMARGGQVYYVYNRVNDIADITAKVQQLVPEASVAYAHGQMDEKKLENIMLDFINGEIDVLVSTTIIETGLDIPNVNTMIIHDSDRMGLSQLYQLRGRVGRSNRTSYAFLMYKKDMLLKETAEKRLAAIREFTDLGSGFKIAMKDLEIRGAGNVLGAEQHGHMEEVGYDLYCKMLDSAIKREKGEREAPEFSTYIDIDIDAFIPDTYVRNENTKLDLYKRMAAIENEDEASEIMDEMQDRFGKAPGSAVNLMKIALLRQKAHSVFVENLEADDRHIRFDIFARAAIDPTNIAPMLESFGGSMTFMTAGKPYFTYAINSADNRPLTEVVGEVLDGMKMLTGNGGE